MKQYGEVFLSPNMNLFVSCAHCDPGSNRLIHYDEFRNHILKVHIVDPLADDNIRYRNLNLDKTTYTKGVNCKSLPKKLIIDESNLQKVTELEGVTADEEISIKIEVADENINLLENENDHSNNDNMVDKVKIDDSHDEITIERLETVEDGANVHCRFCDKCYSTDRIKNHETQRRCGSCPVCSLKFASVYEHIRRKHPKFYQENKNFKRNLVDRTNFVLEQLTESSIDLQDNDENQISNDNNISGESIIVERWKEKQNFDKLKFTNLEYLNDESVIVLPEQNKVSSKEHLIERKNFEPLYESSVDLQNNDENPMSNDNSNISGESFVGKWSYKPENTNLEDLNDESAINSREENEVGSKRNLCCKYCPRKFISQRYYVKHIKRHETNSGRCKYCGKYFKFSHNLNKHLRLHTGERPHKCEICSASFNEKGNLKQHYINLHTQGLNVKCTYENCGKVFKTNARRLYHESIAHSDKYKNVCKDCGVTFDSGALLNTHIRRKHIKYEDREFGCKYCEKRFFSKSLLDSHELKHLGQMPYQCEICNKGMISSRAYVRHCGKVHGKEPKNVIKKKALKKALKQ